MTARQIRRAQEHKERKLARKAANSATANSAVEQTPPAPSPISQAKIDANRANAQASTGPRTEEGKAISSLNNLRHGFNGAFCVLPSENPREFIGLMNDLHAEHKPATPTERLLVMDMARHYWLTQRAIRLQEEAFARSLDDHALARQLALYMRYQTTNQRAFHRCLKEMLTLRKQRPDEARGFESQNTEQASQVVQNDKQNEKESPRKRPAATDHGPRNGGLTPGPFESQNNIGFESQKSSGGA